jgi:hypothetical protein
MQGNRVTLTVHVPGTLAADVAFFFDMPFTATLVEASAVSSNEHPLGLRLGTGDDTDAYLEIIESGVSGTPLTFDKGDFVGGVDPQITKGTTVAITGQYDYDASASANVTVMLTFLE